MAQTFYLNSSTIGVDLNNGNATALFALGTHVLGNNGTEWVYVNAATSIIGLSVCAINTVSYTCGMASAGDIIAAGQLAFAQTSISAQAFGWVAIRGLGLTCRATGSCTAPTTLGVFVAGDSATTGIIGVRNSASGTIAGVKFTDTTLTTSTGTGYATLDVTWPRARDATFG